MQEPIKHLPFPKGKIFQNNPTCSGGEGGGVFSVVTDENTSRQGDEADLGFYNPAAASSSSRHVLYFTANVSLLHPTLCFLSKRLVICGSTSAWFKCEQKERTNGGERLPEHGSNDTHPGISNGPIWTTIPAMPLL